MEWWRCRKVPGGLKLFHDKFARNIREHEEYAAEFDEAVLHNEQMKHCLHKVNLLSRPGLPEHILVSNPPTAFTGPVNPISRMWIFYPVCS